MEKKNSKFNWKPGAIALVVLASVLFFSSMYVKSQRDFNVIHNAETPSVVGEDGRAAVGAPESYTIEASGALIWQLTKKNNRAWRVIAWIFVILTAAYLAAGANDMLLFKGSLTPVFVSMAIVLASWLAAYSSAFVSNSKKITPQQYEQVKDSREKMAELFTGKPYIR